MTKQTRRLVHIYRDKADKWRWRLISSGRIVADSGQGYTRPSDCLAAFDHLQIALPLEIRVFNRNGSLKTMEQRG